MRLFLGDCMTLTMIMIDSQVVKNSSVFIFILKLKSFSRRVSRAIRQFVDKSFPKIHFFLFWQKKYNISHPISSMRFDRK